MRMTAMTMIAITIIIITIINPTVLVLPLKKTAVIDCSFCLLLKCRKGVFLFLGYCCVGFKKKLRNLNFSCPW